MSNLPSAERDCELVMLHKGVACRKVAAGFDNIQMERYERFKRSRIKNPSMKKVCCAFCFLKFPFISAMCTVSYVSLASTGQRVRAAVPTRTKRIPLQHAQVILTSDSTSSVNGAICTAHRDDMLQHSMNADIPVFPCSLWTPLLGRQCNQTS